MMQDTNIWPEQVELVKRDLAGKVRATGEYDAIIWKIRTGYVLLLYSTVGLFIGKGSTPNLQDIANNTVLSIAIFVTILGFSFSVFLIDLAYVRRKLRVVVARDELMQAFLNDVGPPELSGLRRLLTLSGEDPTLFVRQPGLDDEELRQRLLAEYKKRMIWNRWRVLVWLYTTAPILSLVVFGVARFLAI